MYSEADYLPLSALQHLAFCQRQCALIHIEQQWVENFLTAEGRAMHDRVHDEGIKMRNGVRIERGVPLCSAELGLTGKADMVEFHADKLAGKDWPFPVEYKHGKPKSDDSDAVQLCAQALCLEEMLHVNIPKGAFYYGKTHHRLDIEFTPLLRQKTKDVSDELHTFIAKGQTPGANYTKKCEACSFIDVCLPKPTSRHLAINDYILKQLEES